MSLQHVPGKEKAMYLIAGCGKMAITQVMESRSSVLTDIP